MTTPKPRGTFTRAHHCGWTGTYDLEAMADYQLRRHSCAKAQRIAASRARGAAREAAIDRTPKTCSHPVAEHVHGTYACYTLDFCRCLPCAFAASSYDQALQRAKAYGRYDTWIDPEPVRAHVRALMAQGMGLKRIIAVGGSNSGQLWKLLYGTKRPDGTRTPTTRIRRDVADRLLSVELDLADGAYVPGIPTRRRLQALVAIGWSQNKLAGRLGYTASNLHQLVNGDRSAVFVRTARLVTELYDELSMTPPPERDKYERNSASRARGHARARGWLPPLALDDECLDDDFEGGQIVVDLPEADIDEIAIERRMAGDRSVWLSKTEKAELRRRWHAAARPAVDLERICGMSAITRVEREAS